MRFEVGTQALRQALTAVLPIATSKSETYARVRFEVCEHTMLICATNGYAAIVAEISLDVWAGHSGGAPIFELTTADARKVLEVHRMPTGDGVVPEDVTLMISISDESWRSEDTSGLFATAEALEMPLAAPASPPADVAGLVGSRVAGWLETAGGAETLPLDHAPVTLSLAVFDKAQKAYGEPMVLRLAPDRRSALVTIGTDVIGLAATSDVTTEVYREHSGGAASLAAWARWSTVLPTDKRDDLDIAGVAQTPTERAPDETEGDEPDVASSTVVVDLAARRPAPQPAQ